MDNIPEPNSGASSGQARPPVDPAAVNVPPQPPRGGYPPLYYPSPSSPRPRGLAGRVAVGLVTSVLLASLALNIWLGAFFASSMSAGPVETSYRPGDAQHRIVILPVSGIINDETAQYVHGALANLRNNKPAGLVLRVDSPGGGVSASDRIWHELKKFRDDTGVPIVASYGGLAASGGYYISCLADYIVAEPTTVTGSIGVVAQSFTVERLLDKVGVTPQTYHSTRADMKDVLSPMRKWTDADVKLLVGLLDTAHARFVKVVTEGRKKQMTKEQFQEAHLDSGQPFTAQEALANKLIDAQGYIEDALAKAKDLAGIGADVKPLVNIISQRRGLLSMLSASTSVDKVFLNSFDGDKARLFLEEMGSPRMEYRWVP